MVKRIIIIVFLISLTGCGLLYQPDLQRFPQFAEYPVTTGGAYRIPQWSSDGRYLAFIERARISNLVVYDVVNKTSWNAAVNVDNGHFSWTPDDKLTYLKYRRELSGSPVPRILDLHQVDPNGENDKTILSNLSGAGDFDWFSDGERVLILLSDPDEQHFRNDIYILNITTGSSELLFDAQSVGFEYVSAIDMSPDEKLILIDAIPLKDGEYVNEDVIIYSLETRSIVTKLNPSPVIGSNGIVYPTASTIMQTNSAWLGGQRWFVSSSLTPGGKCYNYALFFMDTHDLENSFCIPSNVGIAGHFAISPDLTKISYVTTVGVGESYVMVGNITPDILEKLGLQTE